MPSNKGHPFLVIISAATFAFLILAAPTIASSQGHPQAAYGGGSASPVWFDWLEYGFGPQHLGLNPYEHVLGSGNVANVVELWNNPNVGWSNFYWYLPQPVVGNGLVYYCGAGLCAINVDTGAIEWTAISPNDYTNMPAISGNTVYMGSPADGKLYAFNATTGAQIWTFQTAFSEYVEFSAPIVVDGVVYFGTNNLIYAVGADTGAFLWSYATNNDVTKSSPALANGKIYDVSTTTGGYLYALNASSGEYIWSYPISDSKGSPVVSDGVVYITSYSQTLYALNAETGAVLWTFASSQPIETTPVIANGVLYLLPDDSVLYALNAQTGSVEWKYSLGYRGENVGHLAIANDVLYIPFNSIYAFEAHTGALEYQSPAIGVDAISVANGVIYAGASLNNNGVLYAFGLPKGEN